MAYTESYTCDVCGDKRGLDGDWWLAWVDCFHGDNPGDEQPLIQLTRWQPETGAHQGRKALVRCPLCRHHDRSLDVRAATRTRNPSARRPRQQLASHTGGLALLASPHLHPCRLANLRGVESTLNGSR